MTLLKNKYRIESNRLANYDYSKDGIYFITICTNNRKFLLGKNLNGIMYKNTIGKIVENCWFDLPNHYQNIVLDEFVVMPNHVHGIIIIDNNNMLHKHVETGFKPVSTTNATGNVNTGFKPVSTQQHGLSEFVRALKTFSARRINELNNTKGTKIWQSGFYDRIIRNDEEFQRIRNYIFDNPANWDSVKMNK